RPIYLHRLEAHRICPHHIGSYRKFGISGDIFLDALVCREVSLAAGRYLMTQQRIFKSRFMIENRKWKRLSHPIERGPEINPIVWLFHFAPPYGASVWSAAAARYGPRFR